MRRFRWTRSRLARPVDDSGDWVTYRAQEMSERMRSKSMRRRANAVRTVVLPLVLALCGCGIGGSTSILNPEEAKTFLSVIEQKVLSADSFRLVFEIVSQGQMESKVEGELRLATGGRVRLEAKGSIAGEDMSVLLISDGDRLYLRSPAGSQITETPKEIREALVKGLVRMALLHNLAQLARGRTPERAEGGIEEWVAASEFSLDEQTSLHGVSAIPLHFDITIGGRDVAEATLWISAAKKPIQRRQTIYHQIGATTIKETYSVFDWDAPLPDEATFSIPAGS